MNFAIKFTKILLASKTMRAQILLATVIGVSATSCGCARQGFDSPFVINCDAAEVISEAETSLASCSSCVGSPGCQRAYALLQAHHDYCPNDAISTTIEKHLHDLEGTCAECEVARAHQPSLPDCPVVACDDVTTVKAAMDVMENTVCPSDERASAFLTLWAFHETCYESALAPEVEHELHEFENDACVTKCNTADMFFDPNACATSSYPAWLIVVGIVLASLACACASFSFVLVKRERAGTPIFLRVRNPPVSNL